MLTLPFPKEKPKKPREGKNELSKRSILLPKLHPVNPKNKHGIFFMLIQLLAFKSPGLFRSSCFALNFPAR
ncbi:MAG: hypothetical protein MRECE_35c032 [Mycoplasmataceae bacterium CE_OT135]|nr:MAG: hypothetical protein MRECE_39c014 [Mycoplasmataceae bacterium CE_OT135]KLL02969.1 MAG: hypothetical protein MRECE_35c032 [Mycoplasmataceae bacterium CE_OT135]